MNGNEGCRALRVSTGRFWETRPAAVEGSARGASGSTLTEDQQHVPGERPVHTTESHGDQQHPADLPRTSHGGGSGRAAVPRSREHQSRPAPPSVTCTPGPPRTRPGPAPALTPPPSPVSADPLRRRRETRSFGDDGKPGAVASGECAADSGEARDRVSKPPGYRPGSLVGGRLGGRRGVRECGRLPRGPLSHPLHPHPLHSHPLHPHPGPLHTPSCWG